MCMSFRSFVARGYEVIDDIFLGSYYSWHKTRDPSEARELLCIGFIQFSTSALSSHRSSQRLNRGLYGNVSHLVYTGLQDASQMRDLYRLVNATRRASVLNLFFFFLNKRTKVTCYCQELLFIREVQSSAHSRSTQNISVLSVCVAVFIVNVV